MEKLSRDFVVLLGDGTTYTSTCIANCDADLQHYRVGAEVQIICVVEALKNPISGPKRLETHIDEILEIRVNPATSHIR